MLRLVKSDATELHTKIPEHDFSVEPDFDRHDLGRDMAKLMFEHGGIGLAAPQVGRLVRMFVIRHGRGWIACWNPRIVRTGSSAIAEEGCLSFPGLRVMVRRAQRIEATWQDWRGVSMGGIVGDVGARCFAHELDHLDGITFDQRKISETEAGLQRALAAKRR